MLPDERPGALAQGRQHVRRAVASHRLVDRFARPGQVGQPRREKLKQEVHVGAQTCERVNVLPQLPPELLGLCEALAFDFFDGLLDVVDLPAEAGHASPLGMDNQLQVVAVGALGLELVPGLVHLQPREDGDALLLFLGLLALQLRGRHDGLQSTEHDGVVTITIKGGGGGCGVRVRGRKCTCNE